MVDDFGWDGLTCKSQGEDRVVAANDRSPINWKTPCDFDLTTVRQFGASLNRQNCISRDTRLELRFIEIVIKAIQPSLNVR